MNVVISGVNGYIGKNLRRKFLDEGWNVYGLTRVVSVKLDNYYEYTYDNIEELKDKIKNSNALFFHLAWQGVNGSDKGDVDVQTKNIVLAKEMTKLAGEVACSRFICIGTIAEIGDYSAITSKSKNSFLYAMAKDACRRLLTAYCHSIGMEFIWMRLSNIYGGGTNDSANILGYTIDSIRKGYTVEYGPADQPYDFIYIDDAIEALFRLGTKSKLDKDVYLVGTGRPRLLREFLEAIGEMSNCTQLIKIGARPDDGVRYNFDAFSNIDVVNEIDNYVKCEFEDNIKSIICSPRREE